MTLPTSGQISMSQINTELGRSASAALAMNDATALLLRGSATNPINLTDFYGKTRFVITAGTNGGSVGYRRSDLSSPSGSISPTSDSRFTPIEVATFSGVGNTFQLSLLGIMAQNAFSTIYLNGVTYLSSATTLFGTAGSPNRTVWDFNPVTMLIHGNSYDVFIN